MMMTSSTTVFLIVIALPLLTAKINLKEAADALLIFINNVKLPPNSEYNWSKTSDRDLCTWNGVTCNKPANKENIAVIGLTLPGKSLVGEIPNSSIGKLTSLRVLSLHHNGLSGPFPSDFANLVKLTHVYLHFNKFSGHFPLAKWTNLVTLDLSNNSFSGRFDNVASLSLKLVNFNVSNNNFSGSIPSSLAKFPARKFSGNSYLCGKPLSNICDPTNDSSSSSDSISSANDKKKKLSTGHIVAIAVGSGFILLISSLCLGEKWSRAVKDKKVQGVATMAAAASAKAGEAGKSFSKDDITSTSMEGERNK